MPRRFAFSLLLLCTAFMITAAVVRQTPAAEQKTGKAEWSQFLGPNRNGISAETGLIDAFPAGGPKVLWKVKGGVGMGGLAFKGDRAILLVQKDGRQQVLALGATTGKTHWKTDIAPAYKNDMGDGPRSTPTIDGNRLFVFTGEGELVALNVKNGSIAWRKSPLKEFGGKPAAYGMACSPLIAGELVVVTAGTKAGTLIAYNKTDGKLAWKAGTDRTGYSTPTLLKVGGKAQIVAFTGNSALGIEPKTGKLLWRYPYKTAYDCNIATPIAVDGHVFLSSGENHGSVLLSLEKSGDGFAPKVVWKSHGPGSVLRSEWQTAVLHDGHLYGLDNVGSAGPVTNLACVNARTGKQLWLKRRFGKSNGIFADGKLWYTTMKGELVIVKATPKRFEELSRSKPLLGSTRHAPALYNGRLYLRDNKVVVCVSVSK